MIPTFSPKNIYIFLHNEKKNPKAAKYIEIQNFEHQVCVMNNVHIQVRLPKL